MLVPSSPGSDTENIIADAYSHQFPSVEQDASLDEYLTEQNLEDDAMESTLTENLIADNMKHVMILILFCLVKVVKILNLLGSVWYVCMFYK